MAVLLLLLLVPLLAAETPQSWLDLARTRLNAGDVAAAREAAAQAESSRDPRVLQSLANFYIAAKDPLKAAQTGARYAELVPADSAAWSRVAALYLMLNRPEDAIASALRSPKDDVEGLVILGKAYLRRKEWSKASDALHRAVQLRAYDEDLRFLEAQSHLLHQDFAGALQVLADARAIFDKSPQLELATGVAYYGQRRFPEAVAQFLKTMDLAPDAPQPYAFLGRILEHAGDRLPEVAARFQSFEERNPQSPLGYLLHAKALLASLPPSGSTPEAERALALVTKSLSLEEADADAHFQLGLLLSRKGDAAAAATQFERSVQLNPNDSAAHFQLARVYSKLGRTADAARERARNEELAEYDKAAP